MKQSLPDDAERNTKRELLYQGMTNTFGKVRMYEQFNGCHSIDSPDHDTEKRRQENEKA